MKCVSHCRQASGSSSFPSFSPNLKDRGGTWRAGRSHGAVLRECAVPLSHPAGRLGSSCWKLGSFRGWHRHLNEWRGHRGAPRTTPGASIFSLTCKHTQHVRVESASCLLDFPIPARRFLQQLRAEPELAPSHCHAAGVHYLHNIPHQPAAPPGSPSTGTARSAWPHSRAPRLMEGFPHPCLLRQDSARALMLRYGELHAVSK